MTLLSQTHLSRASRVVASAAAILVFAGCESLRVRPGSCLETDDISPILVGDTIPLRTGTLHRLKCIPDGSTFAWSSSDSTVARVMPGGRLAGIKPGLFIITGIRDKDTSDAYGYVLPRDWSARIDPESVTVRVGQSVTYRMIVSDGTGRTYPFAPFTLVTPEFAADVESMRAGLKPSSDFGKQSLVHRRIIERDTAAGTFVAERVGVTSIIGQVGPKRDTSRLVILSPIAR